MKKNLFFTAAAVLCILMLASACDSGKDDSEDDDGDENSEFVIVDLHTDVINSQNSQPIIILDRNIGADKQGEDGKLFKFSELPDACPKGYHVMTGYEASDLMADPKYKTKSTMSEGLKMPLAGRLVAGSTTVIDRGSRGFYQLDSQFSEQANYCLVMGGSDSESVEISNIGLENRASVRCVKDYE